MPTSLWLKPWKHSLVMPTTQKQKVVDQCQMGTAENVAELLSDADGIIVPGMVGQRGTEGKISCSIMHRQNDVPMLGVWQECS